MSAMAELRVLVVEDDPVQASLLGLLLEGMGYKLCAVVGTERAAVAAASSSRPDVIVIGEHLGAGSGAQALREILAMGAVAHVLVTGDAELNPGVAPGTVMLRKPFRMADLIQAMARALGPDQVRLTNSDRSRSPDPYWAARTEPGERHEHRAGGAP